jgi:hypothetical protein
MIKLSYAKKTEASTEEFYWVMWINRKTGETGSTLHANADEAWDYSNTIERTPETEFVAYVVGKR